MNRFLLVLAVGAAAILGGFCERAVATPPDDFAVGAGTITFVDSPFPGVTETVHFVVSAHSGPTGADAHGMFTFRSDLAQYEKFDVTCLQVFGNLAVVGGRARQPFTYFGFSIGWANLVLLDNGSPGNSPRDMASASLFIDRPRPPDFTPCQAFPPPDLPLEQGNVVVSDA